MNKRTVLCALLVGLVYFYSVMGRKSRLRAVRWWTLAYHDKQSNDVFPVKPQRGLSSPLRALTRRQRRLVSKNPGALKSIIRGAKMAVSECRHQFRHRRWNCAPMDDHPKRLIFGKILQKSYRETAFVYAITSAAVSHTIARACAEGKIATCGCGNTYRKPAGKTWEWGGCSDNIKFGLRFSRKFVDQAEKGRDLRYMINRHNNEAGRAHVAANLHQECKCHGMSGSCAVKTCWMRLPSFRSVGTFLKDRFDGASMVLPGKNDNSSLGADGPGVENSGGERRKKSKRKRRRFKFLQANPAHKPPTRKDLVYLERSPEFCEREKDIDFNGTKGRECNATSIGVDGCDLMCCGRGHRSKSYLHKERCSCTFHWCCHVKCQTCTRTRVKHICN